MARGFEVFIAAAATLCGRIGPMPVAGAADRARLLALRARTGASLMGAATLRESDPEVAVAGGGDGGRIRAFVTASADIPPDRRIFRGAGPLPVIFTPEPLAAGLGKRLRGRARVVAAPPGPGGIDLAWAVARLHRESGGDILVEGGGRLNHAALRQGVVDGIFITIAPRLSGDAAAPLSFSGPGPVGSPFAAISLEEVEVSPDGDLFLRYRVDR